MESTKPKLTKEQVTEALKILGEWFPKEAENFKKHHDDIVRHIVEGSEPKEGAPLLRQNHAKDVPTVLEAEIAIPGVTPCTEAIAVFIADVVFFVLGLAGLHVSNQERITRALLRELGVDTLRGFLRAIHNFNAAEGAAAKAKALFALFSQIYKAGGFRAAFKVIKDEMTWWEWVKTGAIALAQIVAWVATDGVAFIAEVALNIMGAEQMIEDGVKAAQKCS